MRKLYQILYNVVRLTDAPGGGRFLSRGTLWRRQVSLSGGHFGSGVSLSGGHFGSGVSLSGGHFGVGFPFLGDTLAWAGLRGGKALGVTKPAFPPRAPPFRARRCSALWYGVVYWQIPVCCCIGGVRLSRFFFPPDGKRSAQQTCSWWLLYCWR